MKKKYIIYKTINGNKYPLLLEYEKIDKSDIVLQPEKVFSWCKKGCQNYGHSGGCPPFSPLFSNIAWGSENFFLISMKFFSKYKTEKVRKSSNIAIHWKFQDCILARASNMLGRMLKKKCGGEFLSTGYCMGCPGKKCSYKLKEPCRNPSKRTYSMEATGINVVQTVRNVFNEEFYWYKKQYTDIPYMMKTILFNTSLDEQVNKIFEQIEEVSLDGGE